MFLIPLISVDRTDIGYGGRVKADGRDHGEVDVNLILTDCQVREEVGERVVEEKNIGEVVESGGCMKGILNKVINIIVGAKEWLCKVPTLK